uniref:Protein-S-isoprenylcysteine O-methyltransferase Ste14 n=1 Tax=Candidatus Kentrum eta TaxID=2126337 RepID=A0A450UBW3_9GAMM|nr:MAG: Protein-S-isoprenylcysteine O-methyltransferase Ste14 [Candidatus Kentron sp. H]VFJ89760.1 MAG: Protein-S-isoprenylcysteine O-methyltransferase Ste14 [Candidatus Kentron sp. H]VFJ97195.1 MAG: Protein-S-isoprenylcysteine O-methyltransferase Ste14 [Candidatus Kentron sp. H]
MKRALAVLSTLMGVGSLVVFTVFLFTGPFHLVELPLGVTGGLVFDAGLCFAFFLQHSGMIRRGTRNRIMRWVPKRYFGVLFSIVAGSVLLALVALWQESPVSIASVHGPYRWLLRGIFLLAVVGQIWMIRALTSVDVFGKIALMQLQSSDSAPSQGGILMVGPYAWVRHPAYFTTLLMIYAYPDLTMDRLLLIFLFTVWIIIGAFLEERDLVAVHGEDYRVYQRIVPMLIPYRVPSRKSGWEPTSPDSR